MMSDQGRLAACALSALSRNAWPASYMASRRSKSARPPGGDFSTAVRAHLTASSNRPAAAYAAASVSSRPGLLPIRQFAAPFRVADGPRAVDQAGVRASREDPGQVVVRRRVFGVQVQGPFVIGEGGGIVAAKVMDAGPQIERGRIARLQAGGGVEIGQGAVVVGELAADHAALQMGLGISGLRSRTASQSAMAVAVSPRSSATPPR